MRSILGITGTPGTGKKTLAPIVAPLAGLPRPIAIDSLVRTGETSVDTTLVRKRLLRADPSRVLLYGHLLPHVLERPEVVLVAVLRCEPSVLKRRLARRGYSRAKATQNLEAELIGVILDECLARFGSGFVREYDTTDVPPTETARAIAKDAKAALAGYRKHSRGAPSWIDWTLNYDSSTKLRSLLAG